MKSSEIKKLFLDFFKGNNYIELEEYSLIPLNDKSLLFTNSGMVQFKNIFLGIDQPIYDKVITIQKCVRLGGKHNDLDAIGESLHHNTSFEMLGNFSFKNTSRIDTIKLCWEFLVNILNLDINKLYVTVHKNDEHIFNIWRDVICLDEKKILFGTDETNFWSMDENGPCGYCTEIFYNLNDDYFSEKNLLEIWNIVFIEFNKVGSCLNKLNNLYVDTGMGLERITSVMQGHFDNFKVDFNDSLLNITLERLGILLSSDNEKHVRVVVDHVKTSILLLKENLIPANDGRGYILKKLLRRAISRKKNLQTNVFLSSLINDYMLILGIKYTENDLKFIENIFNYEESKFDKTLKFGVSYLKRIILIGEDISGKVLFNLYDTYGLPLDFIKDILDEYKIKLDINGFNYEMNKQITSSKGKFKSNLNIEGLEKTVFYGYEKLVLQTVVMKIVKNDLYVNFLAENESGILIMKETPFYSEKGGQVGDIGVIKCDDGIFLVSDTKEVNDIYFHFGKVVSGFISLNNCVLAEVNENNRLKCANNHSATHLLHAALKHILGNHVKQAGSFISSDYLRFDFIHFAPLSSENIFSLEDYVNNCIFSSLDINTFIEFDKVTAKNIRTVVIGSDISVELCAGTHVANTSKIGLFKILKNSGIGNNLKRIEAVTGLKIISILNKYRDTFNLLADKLKSNTEDLNKSLIRLIDRNKYLEKEMAFYYTKELSDDIFGDKYLFFVNTLRVVTLSKDKKYLNYVNCIFFNSENTILVFYYYDCNEVHLNIYISDNITCISAIDIVNFLKDKTFFKGGGKKKMASGIVLNANEVSRYIYIYIKSKMKSEEDNVNFN